MQHQEEEEALSAPDPVSSEWRSKCPKRTGSEEVIHHTEDLGPRLRECSKVRPSMVSGGRIYQEELESRGDLLFPVLADQPASQPPDRRGYLDPESKCKPHRCVIACFLHELERTGRSSDQTSAVVELR